MRIKEVITKQKMSWYLDKFCIFILGLKVVLTGQISQKEPILKQFINFVIFAVESEFEIKNVNFLSQRCET